MRTKNSAVAIFWIISLIVIWSISRFSAKHQKIISLDIKNDSISSRSEINLKNKSRENLSEEEKNSLIRNSKN